jgi:hypothetical protein
MRNLKNEMNINKNNNKTKKKKNYFFSWK